MMRWRPGWIAAVACAVNLILLFAGACEAQTLHLGAWEGSLEGRSQFSRQENEAGDSRRSRFQDVLSENQISLRNFGAYIYDPRLLSFSLGGRFGLSQDWSTTDEGKQSRQGTLLGYDLAATLLPEKDYSLSLFANRNQTRMLGDLAGRIDVAREARGGMLFAKRLYIPSTFTFHQHLQDQEARSGGTVTRWKDTRNVLTYEGRRGWIDSEINLKYEFVDLTDKVFSNLSYHSHDASLYYGLDFGPELNRHWDSRLRYFTRAGVADLSTLSIDELIRIDHSERLRTNYRYTFTHVDVLGGATATQTAAFDLGHQLYQSLTTNLSLDNTYQQLPGGRKESVRSRLHFAYTKRLPGDGRLNAGLGGGFQFEDDNFRAVESFVSQELHTYSPPSPIILRNQRVVASSVSVTKTDFGPIPAGCIRPSGPPTPLVEGRDYTLRTQGESTEIVPIQCAGATPGINSGDTIAVDYRFKTSPSLSFTTIPWNLNFSIDYRWIRPYFAHEQTTQHRLSGTDDGLLDNQRSDTIGTELRYDGQSLRGSVLGEMRRFTSRRIAYDMARSNQFLGYTILPDLMLSLNSDQAFFDYSNPDRQSWSLGGRAALTYIFGPELLAYAVASIRRLEDSLLPTELTKETSLRARWLYRKVEVNPSFEFIDRRRGNGHSRQFRATLQIVRRFSYL